MSCSSPVWLGLTGKRGGCVALDEVDLSLVSDRRWYHSGVGYAQSDSRTTGRWSMHRLLMSAPSDLQVDHVNGDPLDNRRGNLRVIPGGANQRNMRTKKMREGTGFKGVCYDKVNDKWCAKIGVDGKAIWLGRHDTAEAAAFAYDKAAREHFGEMACCNFEPLP